MSQNIESLKLLGEKLAKSSISISPLIAFLEYLDTHPGKADEDPLTAAMAYARIGNYIDYGALDHVDEETMKDLPVPDVTMLVASASMEQEMKCLLKLNPNMVLPQITARIALVRVLMPYLFPRLTRNTPARLPKIVSAMKLRMCIQP